MISGTVVGLFYLWPLTFLTIIAVFVCLIFTKPEYDDGVLTSGGKRLFRSRVFLGVGCAIYCLCIPLSEAIRNSVPVGGSFWNKFWPLFFALIIGAEISMLTAVIYGFGARGKRNWIVRVAPLIIALLSTFVTFLFLSSE
jgi:hypothetical protein